MMWEGGDVGVRGVEVSVVDDRVEGTEEYNGCCRREGEEADIG